MLSGYEVQVGFTEREFLIPVIVRQRKVSVTSGMGTIDYWCQSIGYQKSHAICGRTRGNETKAKPTIRTYQHKMLTGDTLNRNATKGR